MGIHGEDALKHPDGAVDDGQDRQHGRDAKADAGDPDECAEPVPAQADEDERKKAPGAMPFFCGSDLGRDCVDPVVACKHAPTTADYFAGSAATGVPVSLKRTFTSGETVKSNTLRITFRFQLR